MFAPATDSIPRAPPLPPEAPTASRGLDQVDDTDNRWPSAHLLVISSSSAGTEIELNKALTTLGRLGVQVAGITRRKDGFYLFHVKSAKPDDFPLLNGNPVGSLGIRLTHSDVIQFLAGVKMQFFIGR
jgi:hypothetical protein